MCAACAQLSCGTALFTRFVRGRGRDGPEAHDTRVEIDLDAWPVRLTIAVLAPLVGQLLTREQFTDNAHVSTIVRAMIRAIARTASDVRPM